MAFVSITRLRIRSVRFLPAFVLRTIASARQCRCAPGYLGGVVLGDRARAFWTMTVWHDQAAMRAYMTSRAHRDAMPRLLHWCDEASVVHWTQDTSSPPSWREADARMRAQGRPSKVRHPSPNHASLTYAEPRAGTGLPIRPASIPAEA